MKYAYVYILECADGSLYTGCTTSLGKRLDQHHSGESGGYTSSRLPVRLVYVLDFPSIESAAAAERQIKGWSRAKKNALIAGDTGVLHLLAECRNSTHCRFGK